MKLFFPTSHHYSCNKLPYLHLFAATKPAGTKPRQWPHMSSTTTTTASTTTFRRHRRKEKIIVIMGATGTGKSKLSIDLASSFFPSEIINSDKMQLYKGLDITTNKIPFPERQGVPHHLLGSLDSELSPSDFRSLAHSVISDITSRRKVPIIVGGSNTLIHALVVDRFDPESDVFNGSSLDQVSSELRYNCCFLWVDVSFKVLSDYLSKRVDEMLDSGMLEELAEFYDPDEADSGSRTGLRKAIGVPEFDRYFNKYLPEMGTSLEGDPVQKGAYEEAVREIKENTRQLAKKQVGKIVRLREGGWDLRRLDATEAFRVAMMTSESGKKKRWLDVWEREVVEPSVKIVKRFLEE